MTSMITLAVELLWGVPLSLAMTWRKETLVWLISTISLLSFTSWAHISGLPVTFIFWHLQIILIHLQWLSQHMTAITIFTGAHPWNLLSVHILTFPRRPVLGWGRASQSKGQGWTLAPPPAATSPPGCSGSLSCCRCPRHGHTLWDKALGGHWCGSRGLNIKKYIKFSILNQTENAYTKRITWTHPWQHWSRRECSQQQTRSTSHSQRPATHH